MADADERLQAGDLDGARAALIETVKRAPSDQGARMFLFQLQCLLGEWDKAQAQLRALAQLSPEAQMLAVTYNMAIDAERVREAAFAGQTQPALLVGSSPWAGDLAAALGAQAQGRFDEAEERRARAFEAAPDTPGELDGARFDWIADADARFGPALEAIVSGQWGLLPFDAISSIKTEGVVDLRDLVWLPVQLAFKSGQSVAAFLPTRYPGAHLEDDPALKLARSTLWRDEPWGQAGAGQHLLALSDDSEVGLAGLRNLTFS
ncbi:MAG TPA: type VI secretion system accessory protein TagJ [Phenylobacterium sp.]|nr:type VI secretion system accessory protein TagJ [Phenylobacterium sp.]